MSSENLSAEERSTGSESEKTSALPCIPNQIDNETLFADGFRSGDFTNDCMRQVYHRRVGEATPEIPAAMYRGQLAGAALQFMHEEDVWAPADARSAVIWALAACDDQMQLEERVLSEATERNKATIATEVEDVCVLYGRRFGEMFQKCELVGCELPVNLSIAGMPVIKSHIDLLVRDPADVFGCGRERLLIFDWKFTKDNPTIEYVTRSQQLYIYQLSVMYGATMTGDEWVNFEEWPNAALIHLPSLKPYARNGPKWKAGDPRPLFSILKWTNASMEMVDTMVGELETKLTIYDQGLFPASPDPVRCSLCPSRDYCNRSDVRE